MIVTPKDVPEDVLGTLLAEIPNRVQYVSSGEYRDDCLSALALALTAWENRPQRTHEHAWEPMGVQHARMIVNITWVLVNCRCGEVQTLQLNGTWTLKDIREGQVPP